MNRSSQEEDFAKGTIKKKKKKKKKGSKFLSSYGSKNIRTIEYVWTFSEYGLSEQESKSLHFVERKRLFCTKYYSYKLERNFVTTETRIN